MSQRRFTTRPLELFIMISFSIMIILVFTNVVLRYIFNSGLSISEEVSRVLFVWVTFIGAFLALSEDGHLGVNFIFQKLSHFGQFVCKVLANLIMLSCTGIFLLGSWRQMIINFPNQMPVTGMPVGIIYIAGTFTALLMSSCLVFRIVKQINNYRSGGQS